jgi:hypothetical protein
MEGFVHNAAYALWHRTVPPTKVKKLRWTVPMMNVSTLSTGTHSNSLMEIYVQVYLNIHKKYIPEPPTNSKIHKYGHGLG